MIAELISVGTEILLGNIVNTNASYLAEKCAGLGISNYYQVSVGDNEQRMKSTIQTALNRSDIVIITGGLGPTKDDLTKEVTADLLGMRLVMDERSKERILNYFHERHIVDMADNNLKQAMVPEGAVVVDNCNGTAPGFILKNKEGKCVILLPGPPNEVIPMFENDMIPYLKRMQEGTMYSQMVKIIGVGESKADSMIADLIEIQTNPTIAPYAKNGEVHLRVTAYAKDDVEGKELTDPLVKELKERFGDFIYTTEESENLEDVVVKLLINHKLTLSTAESCTGGLIAGRIVNVSGASEVFNEGVITYSNEAKEKYLSVRGETLKNFGAVSYETAKEMAEGAKQNLHSDVSLAVTGIAGPLGGTTEKPVGLVYISCMVHDKVTVKEFHFNGNRQKIRENTVICALDLLRTSILEFTE
ncbi:MAG: competence/damage-inducible protein cinA [Anaerocolumna sp.]|jgi:nicotinamide-nucleotide amidase|nr:competence/damage-inducible protein cinA [Anaerocolumna sp.]